MEHIKQVVKSVVDKKDGPISTGFNFLDSTIGGYYPGQLTTICGDEDSGKSAFVITQLNHCAVDMHIPTLLVMNNMSERTLLSCMAAHYCSIENCNINNVLYDEAYKNEVDAYLKLLKTAPLYILEPGWIDDDLLNDKLEDFITVHDIKIMFVDEICQEHYYFETKKVTINLYKTLAIKYNIPVVATCCVWNEREGVEGMKPWLTDLTFYKELHGHDIVIGLINYERHYVYIDDKGHELHDTIHMEILKNKGKIEKRKFIIPWGRLYLRAYDDNQMAALDKLKESSEHLFDALFQKLDLKMENDNILPF